MTNVGPKLNIWMALQPQPSFLTLYIDAASRWELDALIRGSFGAMCADFGPMLNAILFKHFAQKLETPVSNRKNVNGKLVTAVSKPKTGWKQQFPTPTLETENWEQKMHICFGEGGG